FSDPEASLEWFSLCYTSLTCPSLDVRIDADHRLQVLIQSEGRKGKALLRLERLRFVGAAQRLLGALEYTIRRMHELETESSAAAKRDIRERWESVCLRVV